MNTSDAQTNGDAPLQNLEEWDDFLKTRYPEEQAANSSPRTFKATDPNKKEKEFRNYEADARATVREFYRLNHRHQTYDFVLAKKTEFLTGTPKEVATKLVEKLKFEARVI